MTTPIFRKHNWRFLPFVRKSALSFRNTFYRKKRSSDENAHLETSILGSAFGDGKFLKTEDLSLNTSSSQGENLEKAENNSSQLDFWLRCPQPTQASSPFSYGLWIGGSDKDNGIEERTALKYCQGGNQEKLSFKAISPIKTKLKTALLCKHLSSFISLPNLSLPNQGP